MQSNPLVPDVESGPCGCSPGLQGLGVGKVWQGLTRCLQLGCPKDAWFSSPGLAGHWDVLRFLVLLPGTGQDWSGQGLLRVCSGSPALGQLWLVQFLLY